MCIIITFQKYERPQSLQEAWELNQKKRNRVVAGMMWLKMGNHSFGTAIDLCDLGLDTIEETDEEFRIGAMVTLRQMETHAGLDAYSCGAIKAAFQDIVGVQFRNGATLGGSLWRRMGFSDIVTAFLAMDSYVELHEGGIVPLERFVSMPYDKDILVRLIVKKRPGAFAYQAVRKQRTDLPTLNCMVAKLGGEYRTQKAAIDQYMQGAVAEKGSKKGGDDDGDGGGALDAMFEQAVECVIEAGQASTSLLQRRCKLGYARAARIMDQMEQEKIIGPYEGAKPRAVLVTKAEWEERKLNGQYDG